MGDVIELARTACPCGWKYPREVYVAGNGVLSAMMEAACAEVIAVCPDCGREMSCLRFDDVLETRTS